MKRKPDLLWILVIILSLGVVTTGYTQSLWERSSAEKPPSSSQLQIMLTPNTTVGR